MTITIGLLGNPNCGKSTLFNALTGARQRVGNWPGVTVERKSGFTRQGEHEIEVIDLPGIYSLICAQEAAALDEQVACETILSEELEVIVNVVDATNLERNLYLTTQLLEMQAPMIVAVNMLDIAEKRGISIDLNLLAKKLNCPVVGLSSTKKQGITPLKNLIVKVKQQSLQTQAVVNYPPVLTASMMTISQAIMQHSREQQRFATWFALRLLEGDSYAEKVLTPTLAKVVKEQQSAIQQALQEEADVIIADARYSYVHELASEAVLKGTGKRQTITHWLDNIILHRFLGIPIFLVIMYAMFLFSINVGGAFQPLFDIGSDTIFVQGLAHLLQALHTPPWLIAVLAAGIGKGINTTITFIPVIGGLFLFLSFLEGSGYMARAAFVVDRLMRAIGLPGKSFVPMIVGFGCNVPAIMATRTLENKRDRILTILMSPFMSCGARLAIYAVFTAAFFPRGGQNVVFALYLLGIFMAIMTGFILRKTVLKGEPSPLIMELPPYHLPTLRALLMQTWHRLKGFVMKAGRLIIPICMLIGALNALTLQGKLITEADQQDSVLAVMGRAVTPIFAPMGIHQDNWPATVGLISGVLAKEVVVGTLNTLYTQAAHLTAAKENNFNFWQGMQDAVQGVKDNLIGLKDSLGNPVLASAPDHQVDQRVLGVMYQYFTGQVGAFAYLLFVLLYFPCVSATAAMVKELNRGWAVFSLLWTTGLAYAVAVTFYQAATWRDHPVSSTLWISSLSLLFLGTLFGMRYYANHMQIGAKSLLASK